MRRLRGDFSVTSFSIGLYSYSVDLLYPFYSLVDSVYTGDSKKFMYSIIMVMYNVGEFCCAREILLVRIFIMVMDHMVFNTGLINMQRFLDCDINLEGMVFEKPGAFPYLCLDKLVEVSRSTKKVYTKTFDAGKEISKTRGVGLVRHVNCRNSLFTVRHVIDKVHVMGTDDKDGFVEQGIERYNTMGEGIDPPVQVALSTCLIEGSNIRNVSQNELKSIKLLFVVSPTGIACPIPDFSIDRSSGDIFASVNLKSGDSGSPVVGVIKDGRNDGDIVLMGAVSRGSHGEGSPNIISSINFNVRNNFVGSPGMDPSPVDVYAPAPLSSSALAAVNETIREIDTEALNDILLFYDIKKEDFEDDDEISPILPFLDWDREVRPEFHKRSDKGTPPGVKARIKSWKKNARAKKETAMTILKTLELAVGSEEQATQRVKEGRQIEFNMMRRRAYTDNVRYAPRTLKLGRKMGIC
jgi:hypothetical protein